MSYSAEAWRRLGELLTARRVQIDPAYRNRLKFVADTGLHERLVSDLERARRDGYRDTSLQAVEAAYRLRSGNLEQILAGGELDPLDPVVQVAQPRLSVPEPADGDLRIAHIDDDHLHVDMTIDTDVTMKEVYERLGDRSPNERALIANMEAIGGITPAQIGGAVLLLRRFKAQNEEQVPQGRRQA